VAIVAIGHPEIVAAGAPALSLAIIATVGLFEGPAIAMVSKSEALTAFSLLLGMALRFAAALGLGGVSLAAAFSFGGVILVLAVAVVATAFGCGGRCNRKRGNTGSEQ
jgi:hypothetical protein